VAVDIASASKVHGSSLGLAESLLEDLKRRGLHWQERPSHAQSACW